jgi:hypothetical protein
VATVRARAQYLDTIILGQFISRHFDGDVTMLVPLQPQCRSERLTATEEPAARRDRELHVKTVLISLPRRREHAVACDSLRQLHLQALRFLG